jgi:hypothetical protein
MLSGDRADVLGVAPASIRFPQDSCHAPEATAHWQLPTHTQNWMLLLTIVGCSNAVHTTSSSFACCLDYCLPSTNPTIGLPTAVGSDRFNQGTAMQSKRPPRSSCPQALSVLSPHRMTLQQQNLHCHIIPPTHTVMCRAHTCCPCL